MSTSEQKCELCGEPMPEGESMFKYHGHSGPCPTLANSPVTVVASGQPLDDEGFCSVGGMAVDLGEYRKYSVGDVIRRRNYECAKGFRVWMIMAVHLGGEKQESTYELLPLDYSVGLRQCNVPCVLLEHDPAIERIS